MQSIKCLLLHRPGVLCLLKTPVRLIFNSNECVPLRCYAHLSVSFLFLFNFLLLVIFHRESFYRFGKTPAKVWAWNSREAWQDERGSAVDNPLYKSLSRHLFAAIARWMYVSFGYRWATVLDFGGEMLNVLWQHKNQWQVFVNVLIFSHCGLNKNSIVMVW